MMAKSIWIVGLCLLLTGVQSPRTTSNIIGAVRPQTSNNWQSASYKGLTVGQSTRADVLRILGKPKRQDFADVESEDSPEVWYVYDGAGEFPGEFIVGIDKKTNQVSSITLYADNLTKKGVIEHFGKDYELKRYDFCPGSEESETAQLYRSARGNALFVEYPSLGIAISIGYRDVVNEINYLPHPIGLSSKRECQEILAKRGNGPRKPKD